jgi:hypothetical protein
MQQAEFLDKLVQEARLQAQIQASAVLPKRIETLASLVGEHAWKVLLVMSGLLAVAMEWWKAGQG